MSNNGQGLIEDDATNSEGSTQQLLETIDRLSRTVEQMHRRQEELIKKYDTLHEEGSSFLGMGIDVLDDYARQLSGQGIELETSLRHSIWMMLLLGQRLSEVDLERLNVLLKSDVLNEDAISVVGLAAQSRASTQKEVQNATIEKEKVGPLGVLSALNDPDVQRGVGFGLHFLKTFGRLLRASK